MEPVIQWVQVTWTKASRGGPGAVSRNAVPVAHPLPTSDVPLWHEVTASEDDGFDLRSEWKVLDADPHGRYAIPMLGGHGRHRHGEVAIKHRADDLNVALGSAEPAHPARRRRPPAVRLAPGEWVRWLINYRFSGYHGWSYSQVTLNLANGAVPMDEFLRRPTYMIDERASLF